MNEKIKKYFDKDSMKWIQESYQQGETIASVRLELILNIIKSYEPSTYLDIGCGDGRLLSIIDNDIKNKFGFDFSESMLKIAKQNNPNAIFLEVDLNNIDDDILKSYKSKLEFISMLGVVHYLDSPSITIKKIFDITSQNGVFILSFRNRIYNLKQNSKYNNSPNTIYSRNRLIEENIFWSEYIRKNPLSENYIKIDNIDFNEMRHEIVNGKLFEGKTDNFWNPNDLPHWRQFTPLEAIVLMEYCGFKPVKLYPLKNSSNDKANEESSAINILSDTSSFLLLSQKL